jgi:hypothetical protein
MEQVYLRFYIGCNAAVSGYGPNGSSCAISDPMSLTLSPGLSYTSAFPGFLSGTTPTPEPTEFALCGIGVLGLILARQRHKPASQK